MWLHAYKKYFFSQSKLQVGRTNCHHNSNLDLTNISRPHTLHSPAKLDVFSKILFEDQQKICIPLFPALHHFVPLFISLHHFAPFEPSLTTLQYHRQGEHMSKLPDFEMDHFCWLILEWAKVIFQGILFLSLRRDGVAEMKSYVKLSPSVNQRSSIKSNPEQELISSIFKNVYPIFMFTERKRKTDQDKCSMKWEDDLISSPASTSRKYKCSVQCTLVYSVQCIYIKTEIK